MSDNKKVSFVTLGCKVNQYETNGMAQEFKKAGYEIVEHHEKADIYIINTCTVTNMSDRKSRQMLRRMKEQNKDAIIVAVGCYAQVAKKELEQMNEIDLVLGNNEKVEIVEFIEEYIKNKKTISSVEDVMQDKEFVDFGKVTYTEKTRAVIKVQDGCDRFCSYCIIPYARGRVRSRKPENVLNEIKEIADSGIKEVVITGIHVASYGKDFKEKEYKLIDLLEEINEIKGIERIRLGSLEPLLIDDEFLCRLSKLDKICHHFHLSLQSGCDATLKRMNRRYSTKQFKQIVEKIRNVYEDVLLTTDIIVGFPQETDEEFEETYKYLKELKLYKIHVFKYSQRKGTKACDMKGQIDGKIKEERSKKLIEFSNFNEMWYNKQYINKEVKVLIEEKKKGVYKGHTSNYILVHCQAEKDENLENEIITVKCTGAEAEYINCNNFITTQKA